jgi:hypothetical protein
MIVSGFINQNDLQPLSEGYSFCHVKLNLILNTDILNLLFSNNLLLLSGLFFISI